jgi:hypothetical protein
MAMKRIFTYLAGFSLLSITTISCTKDAQVESRQQKAVAPQFVNADVPAGQTYVLNLGMGSTVSIQKQALHYQLSEVSKAADGTSVYKYTAAKDYAGSDEVTLQQAVISAVQSSGGGCSSNHYNSNGQTATTFKTIAIKFNVGI